MDYAKLKRRKPHVPYFEGSWLFLQLWLYPACFSLSFPAGYQFFQSRIHFLSLQNFLLLHSPCWLLILPCPLLAKLEISDSFWLCLHSYSPCWNSAYCSLIIALLSAWYWQHWRGEGLDAKWSDTITVIEAVATGNVVAATLTGSKKQEVARPLAKMKKISLLAVLLPAWMGICFCPLSPPPVLVGWRINYSRGMVGTEEVFF